MGSKTSRSSSSSSSKESSDNLLLQRFMTKLRDRHNNGHIWTLFLANEKEGHPVEFCGPQIRYNEKYPNSVTMFHIGWPPEIVSIISSATHDVGVCSVSAESGQIQIEGTIHRNRPHSVKLALTEIHDDEAYAYEGRYKCPGHREAQVYLMHEVVERDHMEFYSKLRRNDQSVVAGTEIFWKIGEENGAFVRWEAAGHLSVLPFWDDKIETMAFVKDCFVVSIPCESGGGGNKSSNTTETNDASSFYIDA